MHKTNTLRLVMALAFAGALGAGFSGCGDPQPPVSQLGANIIDKSIFEGSWYMAQTIIDFDYEAAGLGFVGEVGSDGTSGGYAIPRIRWVIDEQMLYAFRDYQTVGDAVDPFEDERQSDPRFLGQPVAAYRIASHFDIRRSYNTVTGEELNVLTENTTDRRWWDRQFMRVDFSRNLLASRAGISADLTAMFGEIRREPADIAVWDQSDFPRDWLPQFNYMSCTTPGDENCTEGDRIYAGDYAQGQLYHMSFVNLELISPGVVNIPGYGLTPYCGEAALGLPECASVPIAVRTSFLRVSDTREYQAQQWQDEMFERAGYFRLERDTFDTTHHADDVSWGTTDFRNYAAFRHNMWNDWYTDEVVGTSCVAAPDCYEAAGPDARCRAGQCVRRTATDYAARGVRRMTWHTSTELPAHLVKPAFETANEWNRVYMGVIRTRTGRGLPQYPEVSCQRDNPDQYCYCTDVPVAGAPGCDLNDPETWSMCDTRTVNETCAGHYDPFQSPADAMAAGVVEPFDCYVEVPAGAEPDVTNPDIAARLADTDYYGWFGARMVGTECALELRVNTCNLAAVRDNPNGAGTTNGLACEQRGDMRYSLLSYVDQPGTPFLGVAQFRADPVTGELISTDANIGGPALQSVRTRAMQAYDLIAGRFTDQEFFTGEDIRAYLEAANRVDLPAPPRIDFSVATGVPGLRNTADPGIRSEIQRTMERAMERAEMLQGPEGRARIYSDRLTTLAGTDIESRLFDNDELYALAGMANVPTAGVSQSALRDSLMDRVSPFRGGLERQVRESLENETELNAAGVHMVNEFTDDSVLWFVNQHRDWPRARVEFELNRRLYRQTEIHEMGHCQGLRHDFGASADTENYAPEYYRIASQFPIPDPRTFDTDGTPGYSVDESRAFERAYAGTRRLRELAGIDAWMNSAIMEYTANWYQRISGSGYQDWMAISLGYGGLVDIYHNEAGLPADEINAATTPRVYAQHYMGGEVCESDNDCPYSAGGSRAGELTDANTASGLTQRCVGNATRPGQSVCSNFDQDATALRDRIEAGSASAEWMPIYYRYCEDYRAGTRTLAWCNTFDEGDSYREMVRNSMEAYERMYIFRAFRRYRRLFGYNYADGVLRYLWPVVNIQQNLLYHYANDPEYRETEGAFGFYDQFLSAADGLNYMARILGSPGVGAYTYDTGYRRYTRTNQDPEVPGANLRVPLGMGRFPYSVYQSGLTGFQRVERMGAIIDKIYTMLLMTTRGLSAFYGTDEVFYTNFYDLFPTEINQMFRGMIGDQPDQYMPRVLCGGGSFPQCNDPTIVYMDFYRGDCTTPGSTTCRPNPADVTYRDYHVIEGGDTFLLQSYAAIFGLAEFPVYYDTTFQTQLFMCIEGRGDCMTPPPDAVEGVDYVRHTSTRLFQSYLAWQLTPSSGSTEQESSAFAMIEEAARSQLILQTYREYRGDFGGGAYDEANITRRAEFDALGIALPPSSASDLISREIARLLDRVESLESFFNYLIQIERSYGINAPFIYTRPEL